MKFRIKDFYAKWLNGPQRKKASSSNQWDRIEYADPLPPFWLYCAYANTALIGTGLLILAKNRFWSRILLRASGEGQLPFFHVGIRVLSQEASSVRIEFLDVVGKDKAVIASVLLKLEQDGSPIVHVENAPQITLSEEELNEDVRLGKALSALLEYINEERKEPDSPHERYWRIRAQEGKKIERANWIQITIGKGERDFEMRIACASLSFEGELSGDYIDYMVSNELKITPSLIGPR